MMCEWVGVGGDVPQRRALARYSRISVGIGMLVRSVMRSRTARLAISLSEKTVAVSEVVVVLSSMVGSSSSSLPRVIWEISASLCHGLLDKSRC